MIILQQQQVYNELIKFLRLFFMLKIEFKKKQRKREQEKKVKAKEEKKLCKNFKKFPRKEEKRKYL